MFSLTRGIVQGVYLGSSVQHQSSMGTIHMGNNMAIFCSKDLGFGQVAQQGSQPTLCAGCLGIQSCLPLVSVDGLLRCHARGLSYDVMHGV